MFTCIFFKKVNIVSLTISVVLIVMSTGTLLAQSCPFCDLRGKSFAGQDLTDANFTGANLLGVDFSNAVLNGAMFSKANLTAANFTGSELNRSSKGPINFSSANLTDAKFTEASMKFAVLTHATLTGADFGRADLTSADFGHHIKFETRRNKSEPSFERTRLDCNMKLWSNQLDFSKAKFPKCLEELYDLPLPSSRITGRDFRNDPAQPSKVTWEITPDKFTRNGSSTNTGSAGLTIDFEATPQSDTTWVTATGVDSSTCGPLSNPCLTVSQGVGNVAPSGVLALSYGVHALSATVAISKSLTLTGGFYNGDSTTSQSSIEAPPGGLPAFTVSGTGVVVYLNNLIVNGSSATVINGNTAVMVGYEGTKLTLRNVNVNSGQAASGALGTPAVAGLAGGQGGTGVNTKGWEGGAQGVSPCGGTTGGIGGGQMKVINFTCPPPPLIKHVAYNGGASYPGTTGVAAPGSANPQSIYFGCPESERPAVTAAGTNGTDAACGGAGVANVNTKGAFTNAHWVGSAGGDGIVGGNAAGGGGGGTGAACFYCGCFSEPGTYPGTAGGGGGAGGCGALGGKGGMQGGGSFGIILFSSSLDVDNTVKITGGAGGPGGTGGNGASGGLGGLGGPGLASPTPCQDNTSNYGEAGGSGGIGGKGGASGGGAGGNGGPAIGIALVGVSPLVGAPTYYTGKGGGIGKGGPGGMPAVGAMCPGTLGKDGVVGMVSNIDQF